MAGVIEMLPGLMSALPNLGAVIFLVLVFLRHQRERDASFSETMKRIDDAAASREDKMIAALERCALAIGEVRGAITAKETA